MLSIQEFSEEKLQRYGIFQLREIARNVGVHLPTTYKKNHLIEKILQVVRGQLEPFVPKNKKGRPPKIFTGYSGAWDKQNLEKEEKSEAATSWEQGSWVRPVREPEGLGGMLKVSMPEYVLEQQFVVDESLPRAEGIVLIEPNGWGTLHIDGLNKINDANIIAVSPSMVKHYNLRSGDLVRGTFSQCEKIEILSAVVTLNGVEPTQLQRKNFSDLESIAPNQAFPLWKNPMLIFTKYLCPIGRGQRVIMRGERGSGKTTLLYEMAKTLDSEKVKVIFVAVDKRPEDKLDFSNTEVEYAFSAFDMIPFRQMYILELALERAKVLCEKGEDVALMVDDLFSVVRAYSYCLPKTTQEFGIEVSAIVALKKMMAIARNTETAGSITFIGTVRDDVGEDEKRLISQLSDLCNCRITLDRQLFISGAKCFVLSTCHTDNAAALLEKKELELGQKIRAETLDKTLVEIAGIYNKII